MQTLHCRGPSIKEKDHLGNLLGSTQPDTLASEIYLLLVLHFKCVAVQMGARYETQETMICMHWCFGVDKGMYSREKLGCNYSVYPCIWTFH